MADRLRKTGNSSDLEDLQDFNKNFYGDSTLLTSGCSVCLAVWTHVVFAKGFQFSRECGASDVKHRGPMAVSRPGLKLLQAD